LTGKLSELHPSGHQWKELASLGPSLLQYASRLHDEIETLRESRFVRILEVEENKVLILRGSSARAEVSKAGLKHAAKFRRNITTIFKGPPVDTVFDSIQAKARKKSTRERCKAIQSLSPDGVVSWSVAYPPSQWAAGEMADDVFECLIDSIEPDGTVTVTWPSEVLNTLELLRQHDRDLQTSGEYEDFLKSFREHRSGPSRKRRCIERAAFQIQSQATTLVSQDPNAYLPISHECKSGTFLDLILLAICLFLEQGRLPVMCSN
jgi:hypothetical protein